MKTISMIGATIVIFALISYSIAIITEQRKALTGKVVLIFLTLGLVLDITATVCMILGSSKGALTLHGILGYSALTLMLIETVLIWRHHIKWGDDTFVSRQLHLYSRIAWLWWVCAFITGGLLVALKYNPVLF